jgi:hypothetical protein
LTIGCGHNNFTSKLFQFCHKQATNFLLLLSAVATINLQASCLHFCHKKATNFFVASVPVAINRQSAAATIF